MDHIGYCRFCGQQKMIKAGADISDEMKVHLATMECGCDEARAYQLIENKKTYAEGNIKALCEPDGETVEDILLNMVDALARMHLNKASITTSEGIRITLTAKERSIKVERVETIKTTRED